MMPRHAEPAPVWGSDPITTKRDDGRRGDLLDQKDMKLEVELFRRKNLLRCRSGSVDQGEKFFVHVNQAVCCKGRAVLIHDQTHRWSSVGQLPRNARARMQGDTVERRQEFMCGVRPVVRNHDIGVVVHHNGTGDQVIQVCGIAEEHAGKEPRGQDKQTGFICDESVHAFAKVQSGNDRVKSSTPRFLFFIPLGREREEMGGCRVLFIGHLHEKRMTVDVQP
jgi:hypothetical protein